MTDEEQRKIFSKNLNFYVANSGKQQKEIAEVLGFNQKTFNGWCNGLSIPKTGKIQALADYFGIGKSDLLDDKRSRSTRRGVAIPVLGSVAAGIPIEAIEDVIDTEEITQGMAKTGTFFGLKIKGNSMEPKISDGDIVIVRQQDDAESGDVVIACVNGDEATCKRLRKYKDGIELISNNPSYEPMFFSNEDIMSRPVKILGRVMELRAKF